jgi:ATP/maltotriose-dependent transcriptional regulator MalT
LERAEQEAAAASDGEPDSLANTYIFANRANVAIAWGRYRAAARYSRRAAEAAREAGLHDQGLEADLTYGLSLLRTGEAGVALPHLDRGLRLAEMSGDRSRRAAALACLSEWYLRAGRLEEARESARVGMEVAAHADSAMPGLFSGLSLARAHLASGLPSDADAAARKTQQAANRLGATFYAAWAKLIQAEASCEREGEALRGQKLVEAAAAVARPSEARHLLAESMRVSSLVSLAASQRGPAVATAREAITLADSANLPWSALQARVAMCRALGPGDERTLELLRAHEAVLVLAEKLARYNAEATLLRVPEISYIFSELASCLGLDADDSTSLRFRHLGPADLVSLIPPETLAAANRSLGNEE